MVTREQFTSACRVIELLDICRMSVSHTAPTACAIRNQALEIIREWLTQPEPATGEPPEAKLGYPEATPPPGGWPKVAEQVKGECKATGEKPFLLRDLMPDLKWAKVAGPCEPKAEESVAPKMRRVRLASDWIEAGRFAGTVHLCRHRLGHPIETLYLPVGAVEVVEG